MSINFIMNEMLGVMEYSEFIKNCLSININLLKQAIF